MILALVIAILAGLYIALPTGPVGAFAIKRGLRFGFRAGFFVGLGSTTAQILIASLIMFAYSYVAKFFAAHEIVITFIDGIILMLLGFAALRKKSKEEGKEESETQTKEFSAGFLLTITNPNHIATYTMILGFVGKYFTTTQKYIMFIFGVVIGGVLMWFLVSKIISHFRQFISERNRSRIIHFIAYLLIACGFLFTIFATYKLF
ncbi:MAG: LysE family transporter [Candidatus Pacebacteria bacterium]|nr:LysE family transporter [Candidatus Paceibacterota bacterium]